MPECTTNLNFNQIPAINIADTSFYGVHTIKTSARSEYINFAKAWAISTIIVYHFFMDVPASAIMSKIFALGGGGVHLFIFASGFGLYQSKYTTFKNFLQRRFVKVIIPYYLAIVLIFILNVFLNLFPDSVPALLSHLLLYKMFSERFVGSFGGQFWFISTIVQFYLVFPLLSKIVRRFPTVTCLLCFFALSIGYSIMTSVEGYGEIRVVNSFFVQYLWEFVLGMLVAHHKLIDKLSGIKPLVAFILSGLSYGIMAVMVFKMGKVGRNLNDIFSFAGYVCFSVFVYDLVKRSKQLIGWISAIEPYSYALFLTHTFVFTFFSKYIFHPVATWNIPVIMAAALFTAWLFQNLTTLVLRYLEFAPQKPVAKLTPTQAKLYQSTKPYPVNS